MWSFIWVSSGFSRLLPISQRHASYVPCSTLNCLSVWMSVCRMQSCFMCSYMLLIQHDPDQYKAVIKKNPFACTVHWNFLLYISLLVRKLGTEHRVSHAMAQQLSGSEAWISNLLTGYPESLNMETQFQHAWFDPKLWLGLCGVSKHVLLVSYRFSSLHPSRS